MKIIFFSDIHANLPAFEAFLHKVAEIQPDGIYCLGDLVGYNVWPNQIVDYIQSNKIPTIMGNHDEAQLKDLKGDKGNAGITQQLLGENQRKFLQQLPRQMTLQFGEGEKVFRMELVHGSVKAINDYLLEDYPEEEVLAMMHSTQADLILCGHTHKPYHRIIPTGDTFKHVINIGSVGKPKDRNTQGCCVLVEFDELDPKNPDSLKVEFVRFTYDVEKAAQGVIQSDFPDSYADTLRLAK